MKFSWKGLSDKEKMGVVAAGGALVGLVVLAKGKSSSGATIDAPTATYRIPASSGGSGGGESYGLSSGATFTGNGDTSGMADALSALSAQLDALPTLFATMSAQTVQTTTPTTLTSEPTAAPATLTRAGWTGSLQELVSAVSGGQLFANVTDKTAQASVVQGLANGGSLADSLSGSRYAGQAAQWYASQNPAPASEVLWTGGSVNTPTGTANKLTTAPVD